MDDAGKLINDVEDKYEEVFNKLLNFPKEGIPEAFKKKIVDFQNRQKLDVLDMAAVLENYLQKEYGSAPGFESQISKAKSYLDDMITKATKNADKYDIVDGKITTLRGVQEYRRDVDKLIKEFASPANAKQTAFEDTLHSARDYLSDYSKKMTDDLNVLGMMIGDAPSPNVRKVAKEAQGLTKKLLKANRDYTLGTHAIELIDKGLAKNDKASLFNIKDILVGSVS